MLNVGGGKLSSVQISQPRSFLLSDQAQTLADIQAYLAGNLSVNTVSAVLAKLDSPSFGWFIQKVGESIGHKSLFIADGAKAHKEELINEDKLVFQKLPPACPELNQIERFFKPNYGQRKSRNKNRYATPDNDQPT